MEYYTLSNNMKIPVIGFGTWQTPNDDTGVNAVLAAIAMDYGKSVAQICIRWSLQNGFLPLPKSVNEDRIKENLDVFGFELSDADMKTIADLTGCTGLARDPDTIEF